MLQYTPPLYPEHSHSCHFIMRFSLTTTMSARTSDNRQKLGTDNNAHHQYDEATAPLQDKADWTTDIFISYKRQWSVTKFQSIVISHQNASEKPILLPPPQQSANNWQTQQIVVTLLTQELLYQFSRQTLSTFLKISDQLVQVMLNEGALHI